MTRFSVVIPAYNVELYIGDCLRSVKAAAERLGDEVEVLCVDDGSTDSTWGVMQAFGRECCADGRSCVRFVPLRQANAGVSAARNAALDMASGEWVLFVDADDIVSADVFSECARAISQADSADFVMFGVEKFADGRGWNAPRPSERTVRVADLSGSVPDACARAFFFAFAYRRELIGGIRFDVGMANGEDCLFRWRYVQKCRRRCCELPSVLYGYRQRPGSATHAANTLKFVLDVAMCWSAVLEMSVSDSRAYQPSTLKWFSSKAMESFAISAFRLPRADRRKAFAEWLCMMKAVLPHASRLPWRNRLALRMCCSTESLAALWLACWLPYRARRFLRTRVLRQEAADW